MQHQIKSSYFDTFSIKVNEQKRKHIFLCIDPGLKGAYTFYDPSKKTLYSNELPTTNVSFTLSGAKVLKTTLNLNCFVSEIDTLIQQTSAEMIYLFIEKPLKLTYSTLKTYTVSSLDIGKLLGVFETQWTGIHKAYQSVAPRSWSAFFEHKVCYGKKYHTDIKLNRMYALVDLFGFNKNFFYTHKGRFKDGISDSCAMLLYALGSFDCDNLTLINN